MERGRLRIYVGYAPGVGKTHAMLDEARRRRERGTDVVLAFLETHGRPQVVAQARDLEQVARRQAVQDGVTREEMDLGAVMSRRPQVAVVDELAHVNLAGSQHAFRWQDVEELLAAGIDVVSTVSIQDVESLRDVVAAIVGEAPTESVPDQVVRSADQLELVDMTPQALRRRMAHGNIFPSERMDAALANAFREENLARLRELSLLWMADRVDEEIRAAPKRDRQPEAVEARERILVGVRGRPGDEPLVRRAARMAARRGGELLAVHVIVGEEAEPEHLATTRSVVEQVGGRFDEVVGRRVPEALLDLARARSVTQIVLGASESSRWQAFIGGSVALDVLRGSGGIDVHVISHEATAPGPVVIANRSSTGLSVERQITAAAIGTCALTLLTLALALVDERTALSTTMLLYLTVVIGIAFVGGIRPAIPAALASALLINWFFTPPVHTWKIANREDVVALVVFLLVAASVSVLVDREARHRAEAQRRGAEAEALARLTARVAGEGDPLPELVENVRTTFGLEAASVLRREERRWRLEAAAGVDPPKDPGTADEVVELGGNSVLALRGGHLPADRFRLLSSFAAQLAVAIRGRALAQEAAEASARTEADSLRTAILAAVSHDLRTPLASIKASVSSLRDGEVVWSPEETADFLATIEEETDRLTNLVENLLDMSRIQVGALNLVRGAVGFDEVVGKALASLPDGGRDLLVDVPEGLPRIDVDPGLLERAIANIVANAGAVSSLTPVRVQGSAASGRVELRVIDHGPGIPADQRDRMFRPFQRLGDRRNANGVGLGLAVAKGFVDAMDGELLAEDTPGGGLTMVIGFEAVS